MNDRTSYLLEGIVVDTADPQQMGRVKIWCPSVDGDHRKVKYENLPWASYMSPFAGQTRDYPGGSTGKTNPGLMSYGFWAIPKKGAHVVVGLLYGDLNRRVYMGSIFGEHGNRSLPTGRNRKDISQTPVTDTLDPVEPLTSNLKTQFDGKIDSSQAQTRGAYERQVAQDSEIKDGKEGYAAGVVDTRDLDPQTYCIATPGRHVILFQDHPSNSRLRIKSAEGNQIILDDTNERIYVSTAHGKTWVELDRDGHIHMYGAASVSVAAGQDINLSAGGNLNLAGKNINISGSGSVRITGCDDLSMSGKVVNISSTSKMDFLASGMMLFSGSNIHLNGPKASEGECADKPSIVPNHEPWDRPASKETRGKNWKP